MIYSEWQRRRARQKQLAQYQEGEPRRQRLGLLVNTAMVIRVALTLVVWLALFSLTFMGFFTIPIIIVGLLVLIYAVADLGLLVSVNSAMGRMRKQEEEFVRLEEMEAELIDAQTFSEEDFDDIALEDTDLDVDELRNLLAENADTPVENAINEEELAAMDEMFFNDAQIELPDNDGEQQQ